MKNEIQPRNPLERKIQLAGGSTFTISIPRDWGLSQGLDKGETVYIYQQRDRLVVTPSAITGPERTARIEAVDMDSGELKQRIYSAYTAGCDQITVAADEDPTNETRRKTMRIAESLIGMEIGEMTPDTIVINNHLDAQSVSLEQSLVQIRHTALEMQKDAIQAVRLNDDLLAARVVERDEQVDRLFAFISRGFHRGLEDIAELDDLNVDRKTGFYYYKIARQLERVADRAERIANVAEEQSSRPDDELGRTFIDIIDNATETVRLAMRNDPENAITIYRQVMEQIDTIDDALAHRSTPDAYLYATVVESARRTAKYGVNIVNSSKEDAISELLYAEYEEEGSP